ncbi:MAG: hypothetical protein ACRELY_14615, partial [Polyangiaceae bacterium]
MNTQRPPFPDCSVLQDPDPTSQVSVAIVDMPLDTTDDRSRDSLITLPKPRAMLKPMNTKSSAKSSARRARVKLSARDTAGLAASVEQSKDRSKLVTLTREDLD